MIYCRIIQKTSVCILAIILLSPFSAQAELFWEDDFNDGNLDDWMVETYYSERGDNVFYGNPFVKGHTTMISNNNSALLTAHPWNSTHCGFNFALRPASNVYGHWSFDIDARKEGAHGAVAFIYEDTTPETDWTNHTWFKPLGFNGYAVFLMNAQTLKLVKYKADWVERGADADDVSDLILDEKYWGVEQKIDSYHHFDVTRQTDGNITVWLNDTKVLSAIDTEYTSSQGLSIMSFNYNTWYDNIVVDENGGWTPITEEETPLPILVPLISLIVLPVIRRRRINR